MKKTIKVYVSLPITGQESTVMERCMEAKERLETIFKEAEIEPTKEMIKKVLRLSDEAEENFKEGCRFIIGNTMMKGLII